MRRAVSSTLLALSCLLTPALVGPPAAHAGVGRYSPPVGGPIVDHFRPPGCTWCPGNRGIDYQPAPGTVVVASNHGRVSFAGVVAGVIYVVLTHPDGLRTTYGDLASMAVTAGQWVPAGQMVGTSGPHLHFGVRLGERYLDPEALFAGLLHQARLVPNG